jgi:hypothetical protein
MPNDGQQAGKTFARPSGFAAMAGWRVESLANILDIGFAFLLPSVSLRQNPGARTERQQALAQR